MFGEKIYRFWHLEEIPQTSIFLKHTRFFIVSSKNYSQYFLTREERILNL